MFISIVLTCLSGCLLRSCAQQIFTANTNESVFPLLQNAGTPELFAMPMCGAFKLEEATIDDMQNAMSNGTLTSVQLCLCYLQRTFQTQNYINSVLELNPEALSIANQLDAERHAGKVRSPLHGIPFTLKDNIGTNDNMETTAGSWALVGSIIPRDAHVVSQLKAAGAVPFGKAGLSEWADMRSNNYSEGYSARGGQVRSAYNFTVNPGGSSSGSAVGVAANAIAVSIGTETDGSVINPAERNALVGFKPSVGLTSRAGVIPESEHQDSVGSFGRTVRDAVYVLDGMYGIDPRDNYTLAQQGHTPASGNYSQYITHNSALKNATFGLPWLSFWQYADDEQLATLTSIIQLIQSAGAKIINGTEILDYQTIVSPDGWNWDYGTTRGYPNESEYTVVKVDFYNNIATYLSEVTNTNIKNLQDIVDTNYVNDGTEGGYPWPNGGIPQFWSGQDGFLASLATGGIRNETYYQALNFTQTKCKNGIDYALTHYSNGKQLSGLLVPPDVGQSYQIAAQAQYPVITLPAGNRENGMGFGLAIMQTMWGEAELVRWGSAIEDLMKSPEGVKLGVGRQLPKWNDHLVRNLVPLAS
ncbi:hypothetical protein LTR70_007557 [Exophiala xenobiotica]|nr:hypothetical protein LTR70_007557 [Exophiala xenobiotica]